MPRNLNDAFDEFEGGVLRPEVAVLQEPHTRSVAETTAAVTHVDGRPVGTVVSAIFEVKLQQLELAPPSELLYSQFTLHDMHDNTDPQVALYAKTIASMGDMAPALYVLPLDRTITVNGERLPMYRVYHDPYVFEALLFLKRAKVRVEVPEVEHPGAILLMALSRQQHTREPSILEKADTARRLQETYGYDYDVIALHISRDSETGEAPSTGYVSQLVNVSKLPIQVRDLLHRKLITFTHARLLLRVRADETLCIQLAHWVCQDGARKTVRALDDLINDLAPGPGLKPLVLLEERDGQVIVQHGQTGSIRLVTPPPAERTFATYDRTMAAKPAAIRREMGRFDVQLVTHPDPDAIAVTPESYEGLRSWVVNRRSSTTVRETEAVLLGFLEAIRTEAAQAGALNAQGALAPVVGATSDERARQA